MKRIAVLLMCLLLLSGCAGTMPAEPAEDGKLNIVATVFPAYDFARSVSGGVANVTLLLPPGMESHSYEPTPADILAVQNCDLFIYLGGESDAWVDTIVSAIEVKGEVLRMVDCVDLLEETHVEGMQMSPGHDHEGHSHGEDELCEEETEHHHEEPAHTLGAVTGMDEHVWTSPANAAAVTLEIGRHMAELDESNGDLYLRNAETYAEQIMQLDGEFEALFAAQPHRTVIFGDRFPLLYFADRYGLDYYAAFPGCGTQTEPSAATIAFLTEKVRAEGLPTVWYIEFSNHLVADSIAEATGTTTAMFHTCHNVTRAEMDSGATYLSLMEGNLQTLREHLN